MIKKLYKELDRLNRMQLSAMMNGNYVYMFYLRQQMVELCENVLSSQDENSDDSIARSIISNSGRSGVSIETLNSIQSVTQKDIDNGATYLSIMESNLGTLKKVLD